MCVSRGLREGAVVPSRGQMHPDTLRAGLWDCTVLPCHLSRKDGLAPVCLNAPVPKLNSRAGGGGSPAVGGGTERGSATRFYNKGTSWVLCLIAYLPGYIISVTTHAHRHTHAGSQGV